MQTDTPPEAETAQEALDRVANAAAQELYNPAGDPMSQYGEDQLAEIAAPLKSIVARVLDMEPAPWPPEVAALDLERLEELLAESNAAEAALRPERRDLFLARLDASNRYLNALYAAGPALIAEVRAARQHADQNGMTLDQAYEGERMSMADDMLAEPQGSRAGGAPDAELRDWRSEITHPNNRLLFKHMCEKAGIDLATDDIASGLTKVAALFRPDQEAGRAGEEAAEPEELEYSSGGSEGLNGRLAICTCGSFPSLYGGFSRPDDGWRSVWCQGCMEHKTPMLSSAWKVVQTWNDQREAEHAALSEPAR